MPLIRIIHVTFPPDQAVEAERDWKECCAPIMIRQQGCLSEQLLRCRDVPGDYISYSVWDSDESIRTYLQSADHQTIKRHNANIRDARVEVRNYEVVG